MDEGPEDTETAQPDGASRDVGRLPGLRERHILEVVEVHWGSGGTVVKCFGPARAGLIQCRSGSGGMQKYG
jgi:hypothetical protein